MAFIEPMHRNKPNITYLLTTTYRLMALQAAIWLQSQNASIINIFSTTSTTRTLMKYVLIVFFI